MKKEYKILISALVVASALIAVCYVVYPMMNHRTALHREYAVRHLLEPAPLTGERVEEAKAIAASDEMVSTILQALDEPESEVLGPVDTIAALRYVSDEWIVHVMVDIEDQKVISISLNKDMIPLMVSPEHLVQIAEKEFPRHEFGPPILRKVIQRGEDGEVVFLTDDGTVTIRVDPRRGEVIGLEREYERHPFWLLRIIPAAVLAVIVAAVILYKRKSKQQSTEEEPEVEEEHAVEEESKGVEEEPDSPPQ